MYTEGTAEAFFRGQIENVLEVVNDERPEDNPIVLEKDEIAEVVNCLLDNDGLWNEIDYHVRGTIERVIGKALEL